MNRFIVLAMLLLSVPFIVKADELTKVSLKKDTIYYEGALTEDANQAAFLLFEEHTDLIKWISIKSKGGEVNNGMDLGEFIFKHNIGVEVIDYCISSCANYVFSSSITHRISNHAVIGFHGGTTGMLEATKEYLKSLPEASQSSARASFEQYIAATTLREKHFFNVIGVDQEITYLGQNPNYQKVHQAEDYVGWYYSLEDLAKFGVRNISVIDPPWKFNQLSDKVKFFKVSIDGI
ncbi:hypothetical protein [Shewanella pealeana]|nr:hypothetical protein [Shewanella pealeana]